MQLKDLLTELQKKLDDSYSEAVRQNEELNLVRSLFSTEYQVGSENTCVDMWRRHPDFFSLLTSWAWHFCKFKIILIFWWLPKMIFLYFTPKMTLLFLAPNSSMFGLQLFSRKISVFYKTCFLDSYFQWLKKWLRQLNIVWIVKILFSVTMLNWTSYFLTWKEIIKVEDTYSSFKGNNSFQLLILTGLSIDCR